MAKLKVYDGSQWIEVDTTGSGGGITGHGLADAQYHSSSTLAELNSKISDATLDDAGDPRTDNDAIHDNVSAEISAITQKGTPDAADWLLIEDSAASNAKKKVSWGTITGSGGGVGVHGFADVVNHTAATLAEVNSLISDATLIDTADSRLSDDRDANPHGFADVVRHTASTLSEVNSLISDATLIDTADSRLSDDRDPNLHGLGDATRHSASTLAELNALISDATLDDASDPRTDNDAIHDNVSGEISAITQKGTPVASDWLIIEDSAAANAKKKVAWGSISSSAGGGNVSNTGTPLDNQIAIFTNATTIEGTASLTFDGTDFNLTGNLNLTENILISESSGPPPSATAGYGTLYVTSSDNHIYFRDSAGNTFDLTDTAAGGLVAHGFADVVYHTAATLAEVNSLVSDATLDTNTAQRPAAPHGFADVVRHTASTLAEVNTLISDATLIDTADSRLSDDRDPNLHGLGNASRHSASTLAELNALISDATLDDSGDPRTDNDAIHDNVSSEISAIAAKGTPVANDFLIIEDSAAGNAKKSVRWGAITSSAITAHGFADVVYHTAATLAEVNTLVSDATLDTNTAERPAAAHGFADVVRHTASTLAEVNTLISDATLYEWENDLGGTQVHANNVPDGADATAIHDNVASEISVITAKGTPVANDYLIIEDSADSNNKKSVRWGAITSSAITAHGFADVVYHTAATLAEVNSLVSDATLDTNTAERPAAAHGFADVVRHTASTLAEVNSLISDATLYEWENDQGGTQVHANNVPDGADATAIHDNVSGEINAITQKTAPVGGDWLLIEDSAASNAKKRVAWGDITGSGGLSAHGFADVVYHTAATLAEVNSLISDATLDTNTASRPPNGFATGDLTASYPNPAVAAITERSGSGTRLEFGVINDGEILVRSGTNIISQTASAPGAHASTHIHSGSDQIDGDKLDIDYVPNFYIRDTTPALVTSLEELTAHLAGIDNQLSGVQRRDYGNSGSNPTSPAASEGAKYYNTNLQMEMRYDGSRSKWLSVESNTFFFGKSGNNAAGAYFQGPDSIAFSSTNGFPAFHSGTVIATGYTRDDTDAAVFQITSNGTEIAFISSSAVEGTDTNLNADFSPNQVLGVLNKTGGNTVSNTVGWVKVKWRY